MGDCVLRKGFTLIELLAVIIVLAVIALIAVPIIFGIIEKVQYKSIQMSTLGYIDAIENNISLNNDKFLLEDGDYSVPIESVKIHGAGPTNGFITIQNGKVIDFSMKFGNYISDFGDEIIVTKNGEVRVKNVN